MSKSITQNRNESESNGKRDEIRIRIQPEQFAC
jgi:hypothetical protein